MYASGPWFQVLVHRPTNPLMTASPRSFKREQTNRLGARVGQHLGRSCTSRYARDGMQVNPERRVGARLTHAMIGGLWAAPRSRLAGRSGPFSCPSIPHKASRKRRPLVAVIGVQGPRSASAGWPRALTKARETQSPLGSRLEVHHLSGDAPDHSHRTKKSDQSAY
jgi:hypothetical protein